MKETLEKLRATLLAEIDAAGSLAALEKLEEERLGRKGELNASLKTLGTLAPEERKAMGELANEVKRAIQSALDAKRRSLEGEKFSRLAESDRIDVTIPGERPPLGHLHLTSQAIAEIAGIFSRIGFTLARHPEIDWDWYAFESLNMPKDHPARDEWETFFIDAPQHPKYGRMVLTPHTSSGQVREMEKGRLPIRMLGVSKCYRRQIDVTHVPMFHQFEGLLVDKDVSVTHLKGVLDHFAREFFGEGRKTRLRPYHFRFTEPSFEVDVSCGVCGGSGKIPSIGSGPNGGDGMKCRVCKEGWLELGGAGMVHPNVLKAGKIDPEKWSGFAFGWGVERTMAMKAGIVLDDIRELYKNDLRFLRQF